MKMSHSLTIFAICLFLLSAFVAAPVMAATGGATVTFTEYVGKVADASATAAPVESDATGAVDYVATRGNFIVTIEFSKPVAGATGTGDLGTGDIIVRKSAGVGEIAESIAGSTLAVFPGSTNGKKFTLQIDIADTDYAMSRLVVSIAEDVVNDVTDSPLGNQPKTTVFDDLPMDTTLEGWTVTFSLKKDTLKTKVADKKVNASAEFVVLLTLTGKTGEVPPATVPLNQIYVAGKPLDATKMTAANTDAGTDVVVFGGTDSATPPKPIAANVAEITYTVGAAAYAPGEIKLNPQYFSSTGVTVPPPPGPVTPDPTKPTVDISLEPNSLDETAKTFEVVFTFAKVGTDGAAVPSDFETSNLKITTDAEGTNTARVSVQDDDIEGLFDGNTWVVTVDYSRAELPLYVGMTGIDVSATTVNDAASETGLLMVSEPNKAPVFASDSTTRSIAENTAAGMNIGAVVTATDADGDTLTYTLSGADMASFAIVGGSGQLQTKAMLDYETKMSYMVTVTADDGNGGTDSIDVTINVTDVDENNAPVFASVSTTRSIAENTAAGMNIGAVVTATDADGDTLTYTLGGTDAASFAIVSATGQLQTRASLDYEMKNSYTVTVTATDPDNATAMTTVTITVTDVDETIPPVGDDPVVITLTPSTDIKSLRITSGEIGPNLRHLELSVMTDQALGRMIGDRYVYGIIDNVLYVSGVDSRDYSFRSTGTNVWTLSVDVGVATQYIQIGVLSNLRQHVKLQLNDNPITTTGAADPIDIPNSNFNIRVDRVGPSIRFVRNDALPTNGGEFPVTIQFDDEPVPAPTAANFTVENGTISNIIPIVGVGAYSARITPNHGVGADITDTTKQVVKLRLNAGLTDEHGNPSVATAADATTGVFSFTPVKATTADPVDAVFTSATPASGNVAQGGTISVVFDKDPGTVAVTGATITSSGATRTIAVPSAQAAGAFTITLSWGTSSTKTLTYTVTVDQNPTTPRNIFKFTVPASDANNRNSGRVILVRNKAAAIGATPPIGQNFKLIKDIDGNRVIPDANIIQWAMMPDLAELFDRGSLGGGGALVLRKSVGDTDAPAVGTVGISEILWSIDAGHIGNRERARSSQWIEIHNLNTTPKDVLIYAQTGAEFTDSNRVVTNTQAGDTIHGNPGGMIVDVMTNYFNGSDRGTVGWNVPGSNGSSTTGINFVSMARIPKRGAFNLTRRHENKNDKPLDGLYVKTGGQDQSLDGRASGSWAAATVRYERLPTDKPESVVTNVPTVYDFLGTPGRPNTHTAASHILRDTRTDVPASPIIINEIANRRSEENEYEWIELRNVSTGEVNLNNYNISILTGADKDEAFIYLPNNNNAKIPAGGVLLLVDSDPFGDPDHPLAIGWNVAKNAEDQVPGLNSLGINATSKHGRYLVVQFGGHGNKFVSGLPDDGNFILIVRRPDNHDGGNDGGKGRAEFGKDDLDKINDVAGYAPNLGKANYSNAVSSTSFWPLRQQGGPDDRNKIAQNKVRRRQHQHTRDGRAGSGNTHNDRKPEHLAFRDVGYTGIGYKRQASNSAIHGGTPGYDNGAQKDKVADLAMNKLIISELMLSQGPEDARTTLPQWIEIYNPSPHPVGLGGWKLIIENPRDPIRTINLGGGTVKTILSEQTILVVSGSARDIGSDTLPASTTFPATRVYNVYQHQRNEFDMDNRFDPILNEEAFRITLIDGAAIDTSKVTPTADHLRVSGKYYTISDSVGNLDGDPRTNDTPEDNGNMPFEMGMTADGDRTSIIRIFDKGVARDGTGAVKPMGGTAGEGVARMKGVDDKYSWVHAVDTRNRFVRHTWYGDESDWGTPGDRGGQILPVELSFFRPTLQDGVVTIRWTTESELDNAGFNILRSETRNGEFKQVNTELIQGAGTTGERSSYKWVDPTAKPGVVYYYQIEDVSFAGEHQALAITKLKGLISAKGKFTTTWSELKQASQ